LNADRLPLKLSNRTRCSLPAILPGIHPELFQYASEDNTAIDKLP
jgi:hypothetical protein